MKAKVEMFLNLTFGWFLESFYGQLKRIIKTLKLHITRKRLSHKSSPLSEWLQFDF